jgi:hypothetical protein
LTKTFACDFTYGPAAEVTGPAGGTFYRGQAMDKPSSFRTRGGWRTFVKSCFVGSLAAPLQRKRQAVADGLHLVMFGPFFGVPLMVNYYSLRLLPFFTPGLFGARRRYLRERDFFDHIEGD